MLLRRLSAREFDSSHNKFASCRCERYEFAVRALQREAVLIFSAMRIWPERRNRDAVRSLDCLCVPLARTPVGLRRHPALDVPTIVRKIFRNFAQLGNFARGIPVRVRVAPRPADPSETRPSPHRAEVRPAEAIQATRTRQPQLKRRRRNVRFTKHSNATVSQCRFTWQCLYSVIYRRRSGAARRVLPVRLLDDA